MTEQEPKKYEFYPKDSIVYDNHRLYRIRALRDFANVKKGDLGGYIESERNLSHFGNAWVYDDAKVYYYASVAGDAKVSGTADIAYQAAVYGNARVSGDALVSGHAYVYGNAIVKDDATVDNHAFVYGDAIISGNGKVVENARVHGKVKVRNNIKVCGSIDIDEDITIGDPEIRRSNDPFDRLRCI